MLRTLIAIAACVPFARAQSLVHIGVQRDTAPTVSAPLEGAQVYLWDDGSAEGFFGIGGPPSDVAWLQGFETSGASDVIARVSVAFGGIGSGAVPNGTSVTLCVWDDPDDDGHPGDAVLVSSAKDVVRNSGTDVLNDYDVPPAAVHGVFFVGAILTTSASAQTPIAADEPSPNAAPNRALISGAPAGTFSATNLGSNPFGFFDVSVIGAVFLLRAEGQAQPTSYCTGKPNALGCIPTMKWSGAPSASSPSGFTILGGRIRNHRTGVLCYTSSGRASIPFQGGIFCLASPSQRAVPVFSGGTATPAADCSGLYSIDMNAFASGALGGTPSAALSTPGAVIDCQWWGRDPNDPAGFKSSLSDALEYVVGT